MMNFSKSILVYVSVAAMAFGGVASIPMTAHAAGPYVFTTNATAVHRTTAVLNAYAAGIDTASEISFAWGNSRSFGSQTGSVTVYRTGGVASIKLTGLTPGTKYYFRAHIINEGATDDGTTLSFTTIGENAPDDYDNEGDTGSGGNSGGGGSTVRPAVTTLQASGVSSGSAILNATIANPNGGDVKVWFQYGQEAGSLVSTRTQLLSGTQFGASEAVVGLMPGSTYFVRGVAQNTTGIAIGDLRTFDTSGASGGGGNTGAGELTALTYGTTRLSASSYRLYGAALTSTESGSVWIEWGSKTSLGNKTSAQNIAASTTKQISGDITGLVAGKTYYYQTVAKAGTKTVRGAVLSFVVASSGGGGASSLDPDPTKNPVTLTLTITKNGKVTDGDELEIDEGDRVSVLLTAVNTGVPTKASVSLELPDGLSFLGGDGASFDRSTHVLTFATDLPKGVTERSAEFIADALHEDSTLQARLKAGGIDVLSNEVLLRRAGASVGGSNGSGFWGGIFAGGSCSLLWVLIIVILLAYGMIKLYTWIIERKREHDEIEPPSVINLPR